VPSWWKKKAKEAPTTFNARAETVAEKPMFRDAVKRSRCLIPASGYYEWQKTPTGKQPYYYTAHDADISGCLVSCTMLITNASVRRSRPTIIESG
jgi:putative SOS response-associated peptidase YedK